MSALTTVLLSLITGILGALGGYYLTLRRERWNFKKDLYSRLLENLGEVSYAVGEIFEREMRQGALGDDNEEREKKRTEYIKRLWDVERKGLEEVRRAHHVAVMMLTKNATKALKSLFTELARAETETDYWPFLEKRMNAAWGAYNLVVKAAKKDLRI